MKSSYKPFSFTSPLVLAISLMIWAAPTVSQAELQDAPSQMDSSGEYILIEHHNVQTYSQFRAKPYAEGNAVKLETNEFIISKDTFKIPDILISKTLEAPKGGSKYGGTSPFRECQQLASNSIPWENIVGQKFESQDRSPWTPAWQQKFEEYLPKLQKLLTEYPKNLQYFREGRPYKTFLKLSDCGKLPHNRQALLEMNVYLPFSETTKFDNLHQLATGCYSANPAPDGEVGKPYFEGAPENFVFKQETRKDVEAYVREINSVLNSALSDGGELFSKLLKCSAVASVTKDQSNYQDSDLIQAQDTISKKSLDGKIKCQASGAETQDYKACSDLVFAYNAAAVGEVVVQEGQKLDYMNKEMEVQTDMMTDGGKNPTAALEGQEEMVRKQAQIANQRAAFHGAKLAALIAANNAMPDKDQVYGSCKSDGTAAVNAALIRAQYHAYVGGILGIVEKAFFAAAQGNGLKAVTDSQNWENPERSSHLLVVNFESATIEGSSPFDGLNSHNSPTFGDSDSESVTEAWKNYAIEAKLPDNFKHVIRQNKDYGTVDDVAKESGREALLAISSTPPPTGWHDFEKANGSPITIDNLCTTAVFSGGVNVIMNSEAKEAATMAMIQAGVDMAGNVAKGQILANQADRISDAAKGINNFDPGGLPMFQEEDAQVTACQADPYSTECLEIDDRRSEGYAGQNFNFQGANRATSGVSLDSDDGDRNNTATSGDASDRSNVGSKIGRSIAGINKGGGLESVAGKAGTKNIGNPNAGGGGGGGTGGAAAPGNGGVRGGGGGPGGAKSAYSASKMRYAGGKGGLSFSGSGNGSRQKKKSANPFSKLLGKKGGKKGGVLGFRDPASIGNKKGSLFKMISNRYDEMKKKKRLIEYEVTKN